MNNNYRKTYKNIQENPRCKGKVMTQNQFDVLIKLTCRYEYCLPIEVLDIISATAEITSVMNRIQKGSIKEREKMFKYSYLLEGFKRKHKSVYQQLCQSWYGC